MKQRLLQLFLCFVCGIVVRGQNTTSVQIIPSPVTPSTSPISSSAIPSSGQNYTYNGTLGLNQTSVKITPSPITLSTSPISSSAIPSSGQNYTYNGTLGLNQTWNDKLWDNTSDEYRKISADIEERLTRVFQNETGFLAVKVDKLSNGSIIVIYSLVMKVRLTLTKESLNLKIDAAFNGSIFRLLFFEIRGEIPIIIYFGPQKTLSYNGTLGLNQTWNDKLWDNTSDEYRNISAEIEERLTRVFQNETGFVAVKVDKLSNGSIIVLYSLVMKVRLTLTKESLNLKIDAAFKGSINIRLWFFEIRVEISIRIYFGSQKTPSVAPSSSEISSLASAKVQPTSSEILAVNSSSSSSQVNLTSLKVKTSSSPSSSATIQGTITTFPVPFPFPQETTSLPAINRTSTQHTSGTPTSHLPLSNASASSPSHSPLPGASPRRLSTLVATSTHESTSSFLSVLPGSPQHPMSTSSSRVTTSRQQYTSSISVSLSSSHLSLPISAIYSNTSQGSSLSQLVHSKTISTVLATTTTYPTIPKKQKVFGCTLKLNRDWNANLNNSESPEYKKLAGFVEGNLTKVFKKEPGFVSVKVDRFFPGSVGVDLTVVMNATSNSTSKSLEQSILKANSSGNITLPVSSVSVQSKEVSSTGYSSYVVHSTSVSSETVTSPVSRTPSSESLKSPQTPVPTSTEISKNLFVTPESSLTSSIPTTPSIMTTLSSLSTTLVSVTSPSSTPSTTLFTPQTLSPSPSLTVRSKESILNSTSVPSSIFLVYVTSSSLTPLTTLSIPRTLSPSPSLTIRGTQSLLNATSVPPSIVTNIFNITLKLPRNWNSNLSNPGSQEYSYLAGNITKKLSDVLKDSAAGFISIMIKRFFEGSVGVDIVVLMKANANVTTESLIIVIEQANSTGSLGFIITEITETKYQISTLHLTYSATVSTSTTVPPQPQVSTEPPVTPQSSVPMLSSLPSISSVSSFSVTSSVVSSFPSVSPSVVSYSPPVSSSVVSFSVPPSIVTNIFNITLKLPRNWNSNLSNSGSQEYSYLAGNITEKLSDVLKNISGFTSIMVKRFFEGSVGVDIVVLMKANANVTTESLIIVIEQANSTGSLGFIITEITETKYQISTLHLTYSATVSTSTTVPPSPSPVSPSVVLSSPSLSSSMVLSSPSVSSSMVLSSPPLSSSMVLSSPSVSSSMVLSSPSLSSSMVLSSPSLSSSMVLSSPSLSSSMVLSSPSVSPSTPVPSPSLSSSILTTSSIMATPTVPTVTQKFKCKFKLKRIWSQNLRYSYSPGFKALAREIEEKITKVLSKLPGFLSVIILKFYQGSVGVEMDVVSSPGSGVTEASIENSIKSANSSGTLGLNLAEISVEKEDKPTTDDGGMETWVIVVIIASVVVFVLLIIIIVLAVCVKRLSKKKSRYNLWIDDSVVYSRRHTYVNRGNGEMVELSNYPRYQGGNNTQTNDGEQGSLRASYENAGQNSEELI